MESITALPDAALAFGEQLPSTVRPRICVVLPARDEAQSVGAALHALGTQTTLDGAPFPSDCYEILVLANNCRDATAAVARNTARSLPLVRVSVAERDFHGDLATIVHVRRAMMDEACERLLAQGHRRGIIASTDADSVVAPTWLAAIAAEIASGADAVGGRILASRNTEDWNERRTRRYYLLDVAYRQLVVELEDRLDPDPHDPWPRHFQFFGASLAVTVEMYRIAGGLPAVSALEDMAFGEALRRCDARIRHSPFVRVTTSARRGGRVAVGLSTQLGEWDALAKDGVLPLVASAAVVERKARLRRALRELWHGARHDRDQGECERLAAKLANALGISRRHLLTAARVPRPFGMFADTVFADPAVWTNEVAMNGPTLPIDTAIAGLRARLALLRQASHPAPLTAGPLSPLEDVEPVALFPLSKKVG